MTVTCLSQLVAVVAYDVGVDPAGHALQVSPLNALMLQVPLYLCALLVPAGLWALVAVAWPKGRRVVDVAGGLAAALLVLVTQLDFGMQRFRGERLSLNHLVTYGTSDGLNSDWIRPVLELPGALAVALLTLIGSWVLLALAQRSPAGASSGGLRWWHPLALWGAALACYAPTRFAYYHQRDLAMSPQVVLLRPLLFAPKRMDASAELVQRAQFRAGIDATNRGGWLSDQYPLWRPSPEAGIPGAGMAAHDPPDIVIFVIESLRGRDVGWGFHPRPAGASVTPHLDSLARDAVTFPHWIANGEPSPRGFIALHSGAWEHGRGFIIANYPATQLDALPLRLRSAGYRTLAFWGGNPSFDNQLTWARRWYDELSFDLPENHLFYFNTVSDRVLMDRVIDGIAAHDRARAAHPLFAYVASNGTHTPYALDDAAAAAAPRPAPSSRQERYDLTLRNVDAEIGRVLATLRARPRWRNTVVIVVGDHSDRTDEDDDPRWRGMPTDAQVATAALVYGPARLIGPARALPMPASQVDVLPTVLSWLGDTSAVTTLGRSLFDTVALARREAVSVNSRGYRLDRGGYTLLVSPDDPRINYAWRSFSGERPTPVPLRDTPFGEDAPEALIQRIRYWSYLVEQNRVRPRF